MAAKKRKKKAVRTKKSKAARKPSPAQEGQQLTYVLLGQLARARRHFLVIAKLLVEVRDRKLYLDLKHPDMVDYAEKRLKLGRTSLYQYLDAYDWVKEYHPEWLDDKVKGFIPDLNDISDLKWIEKKLRTGRLSDKNRAELEVLRQKALAGALRERDLAPWRDKGRKTDTLARSLSKLRSMRKAFARTSGMPAEVISHLDAAIEILKNHNALAQCGLDMTVPIQDAKFVPNKIRVSNLV